MAALARIKPRIKPRIEPRKAGLWLAFAALLIAGGLIAGPKREGDRGPDGTLAFRRFLGEMGIDVSKREEPPRAGRGTYLLLADGRDEEGAKNLLSWVKSGGRLIVAAPGDALSRQLGLAHTENISILPGTTELYPVCAAFGGTGVEAVSVSTVDARITKAPPDFERCLPAAGGSFVVTAERGKGQIFVLGGPSPFTNRLLRLDDNALFALRLFEGFGPIVLGPPIDTSGLNLPTGPWDALPAPAKVVVVQICVALAIFALVRGRRFGKPVTGQAISPLPSSGLASAVGEMYRSAGAAGHAGRILKEAAVRRIARRMGVPVGTDRAGALEVAEQALVERGLDFSVLRDPEPRDDEELIVMAQELKKLEESVASS